MGAGSPVQKKMGLPEFHFRFLNVTPSFFLAVSHWFRARCHPLPCARPKLVQPKAGKVAFPTGRFSAVGCIPAAPRERRPPDAGRPCIAAPGGRGSRRAASTPTPASNRPGGRQCGVSQYSPNGAIAGDLSHTGGSAGASPHCIYQREFRPGVRFCSDFYFSVLTNFVFIHIINKRRCTWLLKKGTERRESPIMNRPTRTKLYERRRQVANYALKGWTQAAISRHMNIPEATVSRDLAAMREFWREFPIYDFEKVRLEQLQTKREGAIHQFGKARNATTTYTRMDATHLKNSRCD